ncbi:hypothetical protein [Scardovia wiggsiae]|uniref:hypothetical protein n=1 Tax=Scardovia wiggsiae TaxID=230143 RepID=UPI00374EC888
MLSNIQKQPNPKFTVELGFRPLKASPCVRHGKRSLTAVITDKTALDDLSAGIYGFTVVMTDKALE